MENNPKAKGTASAYAGNWGISGAGATAFAAFAGTLMVSNEVTGFAPAVMSVGDNEHVGRGVGPYT
jgi:hypothetical protein